MDGFKDIMDGVYTTWAIARLGDLLPKVEKITGVYVYLEDTPIGWQIQGDVSKAAVKLHEKKELELLAALATDVNICKACEKHKLQFDCSLDAVCWRKGTQVEKNEDKELTKMLTKMRNRTAKQVTGLYKKISTVVGFDVSDCSTNSKIKALKILKEKNHEDLLTRFVTEIESIDPCALCKKAKLEFSCPWILKVPSKAKAICWRL